MECIRQKGETDTSARDILMRMMEVFILKFQSIAEYHIPEIMERWLVSPLHHFLEEGGGERQHFQVFCSADSTSTSCVFCGP